LCAFEAVRILAVEQSDGVVEGVSRRVDVAGFECCVVARGGEWPANHMLGGVVAGILPAEGLEEGGFLLL